MSISQVTACTESLILTKWVQSYFYARHHLGQGTIMRDYDIKALWSKVLSWVQFFDQRANTKLHLPLISTKSWNNNNNRIGLGLWNLSRNHLVRIYIIEWLQRICSLACFRLFLAKDAVSAWAARKSRFNRSSCVSKKSGKPKHDSIICCLHCSPFHPCMTLWPLDSTAPLWLQLLLSHHLKDWKQHLLSQTIPPWHLWVA